MELSALSTAALSTAALSAMPEAAPKSPVPYDQSTLPSAASNSLVPDYDDPSNDDGPPTNATPTNPRDDADDDSDDDAVSKPRMTRKRQKPDRFIIGEQRALLATVLSKINPQIITGGLGTYLGKYWKSFYTNGDKFSILNGYLSDKFKEEDIREAADALSRLDNKLDSLTQFNVKFAIVNASIIRDSRFYKYRLEKDVKSNVEDGHETFYYFNEDNRFKRATGIKCVGSSRKIDGNCISTPPHRTPKPRTRKIPLNAVGSDLYALFTPEGAPVLDLHDQQQYVHRKCAPGKSVYRTRQNKLLCMADVTKAGTRVNHIDVNKSNYAALLHNTGGLYSSFGKPKKTPTRRIPKADRTEENGYFAYAAYDERGNEVRTPAGGYKLLHFKCPKNTDAVFRTDKNKLKCKTIKCPPDKHGNVVDRVYSDSLHRNYAEITNAQPNYGTCPPPPRKPYVKKAIPAEKCTPPEVHIEGKCRLPGRLTLKGRTPKGIIVEGMYNNEPTRKYYADCTTMIPETDAAGELKFPNYKKRGRLGIVEQ